MSGWFSVKHGISKHPMLRGRPERIAVWIWLLDNAAYQDTPHDIGGKEVMIRRGQVAVSQRRLAEETGVSRQVIRTFLGLLQSSRMVNPDPTHGKTIITICNYEKYQVSGNVDNPGVNPELTHDQPIKEQINNIPVGKGASAPSLTQVIFGKGLDVLQQLGMPQQRARTMLGKWRKEFSEEQVIAALSRCEREQPLDPIEFMQGCFRYQAKRAEPEYGQYRQNPTTGHKEVFLGGDMGWTREH